MLVTLVCEATETTIALKSKCARLFHDGDIIKVSYLLPSGFMSDRLRGIADESRSTVTINSNTVWLEFTVLKREFFVMAHDTSTDSEPQTCAIFVRPASPAVHEVIENIQVYWKKQEG